MNILVISHTYISPVNRTKWLVLAKQHPELQITVLIPHRWKTSFFEVESKGVALENVRNCKFISMHAYFAGNELLYFFSPIAFIKLLRTTKPEVIHVEQGLQATSYLQAIFFNKILRLNARCYFFTWINWEPILGLKTKIMTKILGYLNARGSNGAIAGNQDAKKILTTTYPALATIVLPQLGVDTELFRPSQTIHPHNKILYIAYIGRLVEEKGVMTLLKAYSKLAPQFTQWNLLIVGGGPQEKELIDYTIRKKLMHRVEFQPPVSHEKIAEILKNISLLILPSIDTTYWREQFGHVLIEGMSARVCVVGSDAGEIPHVIQDGGVIFRQNDEDDLYTKLNALMSDEALRNKVAQKGFERVLKHYTHTIIAEKTYNFWNTKTTDNHTDKRNLREIK